MARGGRLRALEVSAAFPAIRSATAARAAAWTSWAGHSRSALAADLASVVRSYLSAAQTTSARALAAKAAVLIIPSDRAGEIIWPDRR